MSGKMFARVLSLALAAALLLGLCMTAFAAPPELPAGEMGGDMAGQMPPDGMDGGMPPDGMGGGNGVPAPPPGGGGSRTFYYAEAQDGFIETELTDGTFENVAFPEFSKAETFGNSVRAKDAVVAALKNCAISKTAGTFTGGDDGSFYGVNSALLVCDNANVTLDGGSVVSDNSGGNGVFVYGKAQATLKNTTVITDKSGSGGIMVAGGGTLKAENCNVWTEGGSSAAIRSDRGSGLMQIDGGTYVSNGSIGTGSPAIYCVADITVSNAVLISRNAQAMCFEGRNPSKLYNCYLEGKYTASDDDEACNVMIYQSMSGDSAEGTSYFTMVGGVLKDNCELENAKMIYTTNTYCYVSLAGVDIQYASENEPFLLCACNTNRRGWGKAGANGSECGVYCVDQVVTGDIIYDTYSFLSCFFTEGSKVENTIYAREDNGERGCDVYFDVTSSWTLTGDSLVRDLYTGGAAITGADGKTVTIKAADGTVYVQGDSAFTLTVTGTYSEEDHSDVSYMPAIGTATEYTFDPAALMAEYGDESFDPSAVVADTYTKPEVPAIPEESVSVPETEPAAEALNPDPVVVPSTQKLSVNGIAVSPAAYNCDGSNYFKIRDLAALLSYTSYKFNVSFDEAANSVVITAGEAYVPVGGELTPVDQAQSVVVSSQGVLLNGIPVSVNAYNIDGYNYFKLRDLGAAFGFEVGYDDATATILINTGDAPQAEVPAEPAPAEQAPAAPEETPTEEVPADDGMGGQGNTLSGGTAKAPTEELFNAYVSYIKAYMAELASGDMSKLGDGGMDAGAISFALSELDAVSYATADLTAFPFEMYVTLFGAMTYDAWAAQNG